MTRARVDTLNDRHARDATEEEEVMEDAGEQRGTTRMTDRTVAAVMVAAWCPLPTGHRHW